MNPLQRTLIEKAGHDNGFEHVLPGDAAHAALASARHPAQVSVAVGAQGYQAQLTQGPAPLGVELARSFPPTSSDATLFSLPSEAALAQWLRRAAALAQALPNQVVTAFEQQVQAELKTMPQATANNTEVLRMVRQRVGQQTYRQALLDYWGGACAVTGVSTPQALRASHAKPWADCDTDAERLDVYNGFLLSANLDALFDSFMISFTDQGALVVAEQISSKDRQLLGVVPGMSLRWLSVNHLPYLRAHRDRFAGFSKG
ncbi:MAG: HNH endonuclease [Burkholderiales bacterium]|nr:HNH endonuclease [Burkholderiales bacterium]